MRHEYIKSLNPDIVLYDETYRDLLYKFIAGDSPQDCVFTEFLLKEIKDYNASYDGVTYLILNYGETTADIDIIGYYTLSTKSLLIEDRIEEDGKVNVAILEIPAVEIKMFAIDKRYQDKFFKYKEYEKPVAAWVFEEILSRIDEMAHDNVAFKAVFLRSVAGAEEFYLKNGFHYYGGNMLDTFSIDADLKPMYHRLAEIYYNKS